MSETPEVVVIGETSDGVVAPITQELIAAATPIAASVGGSVVVILCGNGISSLATTLIQAGSDKVYTLDDQLLCEPNTDAYVAALLPLLKEIGPPVVLLGRTLLGSDLGPRLAFSLNAGLAQDSISVVADEGDSGLIAERPVYGGVSVARVRVVSKPALATIRPKIFDPLPLDPTRQGEVVPVNCGLQETSIRINLHNREVATVTGITLDDASVVVAGGRGLGGPEPFEQLQILADLLGGAVGASRAVCDAGWMPYSYQIGLTGKAISAEVYIAVGISGASQHMTGISGVKNIIGINKDGNCDLFKSARFGVVGEWEKVLPAFIDGVRGLATA